MNKLHNNHESDSTVLLTVSDRILTIRTKIEDSSYVNNAILLIASVLSKKLVEQPKLYS